MWHCRCSKLSNNQTSFHPLFKWKTINKPANRSVGLNIQQFSNPLIFFQTSSKELRFAFNIQNTILLSHVSYSRFDKLFRLLKWIGNYSMLPILSCNINIIPISKWIYKFMCKIKQRPTIGDVFFSKML